ncbi:error-prone DNA polymerase [Octadecabacter sp. 1_MG-2023]|uniref:error-prone DNA polymerase n=1 Tax=unclassified Octadecabacter TaxID=196158 RepID=UPI001C0A0750|nr:MULTISPECIES: error-prone DNA polymerase [unclassified Octadecabacter]MBU2991726.1 error-prone DNA polymerase [Octadecabacter sp. B2R22]MDO6735699.1 error-prone DNA polymerase [Octadecabacter sp. 1_MG-2023]
MPEIDNHFPRHTLDEGAFTPNARSEFVELGVSTCFSFLRGASDAADLAAAAWTLGYDAIGCADLNTMAGVVRLHSEALKACMRPVIGCRLALVTGEEFLAYPRNRAAYGRLCALLSKGKMHGVDGEWQAKGVCDITLEDLAIHSDGVQLIALPPTQLDTFIADFDRLKRALPTLRHIAASYLYHGDDVARINRLDALAKAHGVSILATNDVHYHAPDRRPLQDVMTCILHKTTIQKAGFLLQANAERHLKSATQMKTLFERWPHAIRATRVVADACQFDLRELSYEYPTETVPEGRTPQDYLTELTWKGADWRYPNGVPEKVTAALNKELAMIEKLDIPQYFLTIHQIVNFARYESKPAILCQGRGSAANSAVCYVLGITAVDPDQNDLLFERFISEERKEPPDIDVDFEHERREEVIQHIYAKYGRGRAALCATVIHYRPRMAVREVGKVMGLSEDVTTALSKTIWGSWGREVGAKEATEAGLDLSDPLMARTIKLADQMIGMPRHLGQHVGGFILTENPLIETVPIGNGAMPDRSFIEWDKDDIEELRILKVDILALGMLTCIRKAFDLIDAHYGKTFTLASVPQDDDAVYDMLCKGDSLGVFQVESRAQMNMLPRLKPREFYDLVIQVAIVRPGPIQGDMVHPYLRRRSGVEPEDYPAPAPPHDPDELLKVLGRTKGVPIFQEQAMKVAMVAAEFSTAEANQLRKAMATFRSRGTIGELEEKMVGRMIKRGYDPEFATRCFNQIKGFGDYGFPESHAASFAHLVYVSSWIKCHYPDVFCAALLNSQPLGFYAPAQIVRDLREHDGIVRAADVNYSDWDNTLEPVARGVFAVRLGLRQVDGVRQDMAQRVMDARQQPFTDLEDLKSRAGLGAAVMRRLAAADAFRSMTLDRRQALWDARALRDAPDLPLFSEHRDEGEEQRFELPQMPICEQVVSDYQTTRLSLKAHPIAFLRQSMRKQGYTDAKSLRTARNGQSIKMAGIVLIRQRPGSAKGVCFITLEDETGVANLVVWPKMMEAYRKVIMGSRILSVHGTVQRSEDVIHIVAHHLENRSDVLDRLSGEVMPTPLARADEVKQALPQGPRGHPRNARIIPKSRDFH